MNGYQPIAQLPAGPAAQVDVCVWVLRPALPGVGTAVAMPQRARWFGKLRPIPSLSKEILSCGTFHLAASR